MHILLSKVLERIALLQRLCAQEVKHKCSTASIIPHKVKTQKQKHNPQKRLPSWFLRFAFFAPFSDASKSMTSHACHFPVLVVNKSPLNSLCTPPHPQLGIRWLDPEADWLHLNTDCNVLVINHLSCPLTCGDDGCASNTRRPEPAPVLRNDYTGLGYCSAHAP